MTTSGTLALGWTNQAPNAVLAGPAGGSAGAPAFRGLDSKDLPAAPVYDGTGRGRTGLWGLGGANQVRANGFVVESPVIFRNIVFTVVTPDETGCGGSGCLYDLGIYDASGALKAHIGPITLTSAALQDRPIAGGGTARLEIGKYYLAFTGNGTDAKLGQDGATNYVNFCGNCVLGSSTGGALPATNSIPADAWALSVGGVWFLLHN